LTGRINIDELKAVVARLDLFISADTGPIYIAEAFQVPTVDIVGPVDEKEQPLIGLRNLIVVAKRKRPELKVMNARFYNEEEARRQVEEIKLEKVINKFEELLKVLR